MHFALGPFCNHLSSVAAQFSNPMLVHFFTTILPFYGAVGLVSPLLFMACAIQPDWLPLLLRICKMTLILSIPGLRCKDRLVFVHVFIPSAPPSQGSQANRNADLGSNSLVCF